MKTPLAHGIDLVDLQEFDEILRRNGEKFIDRIFTPAEREYCLSQNNASASFAARFAAKEAVAKALGTGIGKHASFLDIEVTRDPETRQPDLQLHGNALQTASDKNISCWLISLTHTKTASMASVIGYGK